MNLPHGLRTCVVVLAAGTLAVTLAGCGQKDSTASPPTSSGPTTPASSPTATTSAQGPATERAAITKAYVDFFSGKTAAARKVALVQQGKDFADVIGQQATSPLSKSTAVTVSSVTLQSPTSASVRYTILLGGTPALKDQTGAAIKENGVWKVGSATFCALLTLEQSAPPLCKSAS